MDQMTMNKMSLINETMIRLLGVPAGRGLAPDYPLRKEWIAVAKAAGVQDTPVNRRKLQTLIDKFKSKLANQETIALPTITNADQRGNVLHVARIDDQVQNGYVVGATVVTTDGQAKRVPEELLDWAAEVIAKDDGSFFPCHVEFGILHGRAYAEFLD